MKQLIALALLLCSASVNAQITCSALDGASVYSSEQPPRYLGFFGSEYATESIMNRFGYGSEYRTDSVRNPYGRYGSEYSSYSAKNQFASNPPGIYKNNELIGYLTSNNLLTGAVSLAKIDASCTFYSSSPSLTSSSKVPDQTSSSKVPDRLTGLTLAPGNEAGQIQLQWDAIPEATRYDVYTAFSEDGERTFISSTTEPALLVTGATPDVTYYFFVFPANVAGSGNGMRIAGQGKAPENQPTGQSWPAPFTGIFPDRKFGLKQNNIGHLNEADGMIYTCVAIFNGDNPGSIDGLHKLGLGLQIESMEQGVIRVAKSRPFNESDQQAIDGQQPSCSGRFDTNTNRYTDIIQIGNQVFDASFDLTDAARLQLRLRNAVEIQPAS